MAPAVHQGPCRLDLSDGAGVLVLVVSHLLVGASGVPVVPHVPVQRCEVPHLVDKRLGVFRDIVVVIVTLVVVGTQRQERAGVPTKRLRLCRNVPGAVLIQRHVELVESHFDIVPEARELARRVKSKLAQKG